jgi:hypothetical protein
MSDLQSETLIETQDNSDLKQNNKGTTVADENNVIGSSGTNRKGGKRKSSFDSTENGALTSAKANNFNKMTVAETKKAPKDTTVAIYSERNVTWQDVGKIETGYNIVSKEAAEKWLTRGYIRLATPEEVAREFGV